MNRTERALWLGVALVVAAIACGAVGAGTLVGRLGSEAVVGIAFTIGFALSILAVVGVTFSGGRVRELWTGIGVAAVLLMIPVRSGVPALDRTHLFEYGVLATLIYSALRERASRTGRSRLPAIWAIGAGTLIGWLDETLQRFLPDRVYDLRDVGVNALAALVAVGFIAASSELRDAVRLRRAGRRPAE